MTNTIPFGKSYTSPHDLVSLLQLRGLYIPDALKAEHYLEHIGYYRLSAYMHPLLEIPKEHHLYKRGATFSKVMMLYRFDKKLRLLLFNELEKTDSLRVYYNICIIKYFLNIISPNNDLFQKIKTLLAKYPEIDLNALGFPQGWESEPLWRQP